MNPETRTAVSPFGRTVAAHSLAWLVAANAVGLWMAASLLWPALGNLLAPLTYGRWAPLHLDWQLYGWCALPVVGALLAWCLDSAHPHVRGHAQFALAAWSMALALGGIAWLGGITSGKLFLDWHGWARPLLPLAMHVLWALLATHTWWRWGRLSRAERTARVVLLVGLLAVPTVLYVATHRGAYPPVNPDSGGATGASLLGSTLGIVTIGFLLPGMLGVAARGSSRVWIIALVGAWLVFAASDRGSVSHHRASQIIALATLLAWIPLLPLFWARHAWPPHSAAWRHAATLWWTVLVLTGWLTFLPHVSEALKFTHALVGHAHLAMAGFLTSLNGLILVVLTGRSPGRATFWLWQASCMVHVASLVGLGWAEIDHAAELFRSETWSQVLLGLRFASGLGMTLASVLWCRGFLRR